MAWPRACRPPCSIPRMPDTTSRVNGISVVHLCDHPEHLPLLAGWIHAAFWTRSRYGVDHVAGLLREAVDPERIPLSLLALVGEVPGGTVQLIACDSRERPDLTPWLAALFVVPEHREKGVGGILVRRLAAEADRLGCAEMFLETDIPDFYARFGAVRFQPLAEGGWIMRMPCTGATTRDTAAETVDPGPTPRS